MFCRQYLSEKLSELPSPRLRLVFAVVVVNALSGCAWLNSFNEEDAAKTPVAVIEPKKEETEPRPPLANSVGELAQMMVTELIEKAAAKIPSDKPAPRAIALQPHFNLDSGVQTLGGKQLDSKLVNVIEGQFQGLPVTNYDPTDVLRADWMMISGLKVVRLPRGSAQLYELQVCGAIVDLRSNRTLSMGIYRAPYGLINLVPRAYYRDLPVAVAWRENPLSNYLCKPTPPPRQLPPGMSEALQANAMYGVAKDQYERKAYASALKTFRNLRKKFARNRKDLPRRYHIARLGEYLALWRLGRNKQAGRVRASVIRSMIKTTDGIGLNLALSPISMQLIAPRQMTKARKYWIWSVSSYLKRSRRCARIIGTARGKLAEESAGNWTGLAHARWAAGLMKRWHGLNGTRVQVAYRGGVVEQHRIDTGDARDEWDRLLRIRQQRCA